MSEELLKKCEASIDEIYARCHETAPNFGVRPECFKASLNKTLGKYLQTAADTPATQDELTEFLNQLQCDDLYMALACANGNERAWWEFDQQHRSYLERVARHLAKTEVDAQEVIDQVYVDLYGTKIVDGERVSKFSTYSGRGSLRGWLRTVIWHSLVDLHRASHDEVSLDEMTDQIARDRYRKATITALESAFSSLDDHEQLLLLYYHVENLKLREIARLVENEASPLRGWFQRKSQSREQNPTGRIHESTIMRWLEKSYGKVLQLFRGELQEKHSLTGDEIDICMELATQDLAGNSLFRNLTTT